MADEPSRWDPTERDRAYRQLDHPADIFLEVWGADLPSLFENALFALYDQLAELEGFESVRKETIRVSAPSPADALRSLLAEALYRFATENFVAARAEITVETGATSGVEVIAQLHGESHDRHRHFLLTEVKAVTYHQLTVEATPDGRWQATVLLDV